MQLNLINPQQTIVQKSLRQKRAELRIETLELEAQKRAQKRSIKKVPKFLTEQQMKQLIDLAKKKKGRHANRNVIMIMMAYHFGLRVSELCNMKWRHVNLEDQVITIERLKEGRHRSDILTGEQLRRLKRLKRQPGKAGEYVFLSQEGAPVHRRHFHRIISNLGKEAGFPFAISPHTLRHSCGYKLANDGRPTRDIQAYLGHAQINNTVLYTELSPNRLKGIWRD